MPDLVTVEELKDVLRIGRSKAYEIARKHRVKELGDRIIRVRRSDLERIVRGEFESVPPLRAVK